MELVNHNGKIYKKCCGNCSYYLGRNEFNENGDNCDCKEKKESYEGRFFPNHYSSDEPCKFFLFKAKREYKTKQSEVYKAALLLKEHCKSTRCGNCELFIKEENKCRLETKRDYNFNTVPRDWDI